MTRAEAVDLSTRALGDVSAQLEALTEGGRTPSFVVVGASTLSIMLAVQETEAVDESRLLTLFGLPVSVVNGWDGVEVVPE